MTRRQVRHVSFDGALVRSRRQALGLTNEQLALAVGATLRTIQRWQLGESAPSGHQLVCLAAALGIDAADLYREQAGAA